MKLFRVLLVVGAMFLGLLPFQVGTGGDALAAAAGKKTVRSDGGQKVACLDEVNRYRAYAGLPALVANNHLTDGAQYHASEMRKYGYVMDMGYDPITETFCITLMQEALDAGFPAHLNSSGVSLGGNAFNSGHDAAWGWCVASLEHFALICDPRWKQAGVGRASDKWAMFLGE